MTGKFSRITYAVIKISSMCTFRSDARTIRLSTVGSALPVCHLYIAWGELNPKAICKSCTDSPAALRRFAMFAPVRAMSITGIFTVTPPFLNYVKSRLSHTRQAALIIQTGDIQITEILPFAYPDMSMLRRSYIQQLLVQSYNKQK